MNYLDAAKTVRGGTATFSLTGPRLLRVVLDAEDAEAAGNLAELLQQALRMASGGLVVAKQTIPKEMQATLGPAVKLAEQFVDGGNAKKSDTQVIVDFKRPEMLDTAGPQIATALRQSVMDARAAARRAQQLNNMKQICIAMLMYEQIHRSFPPAAIEKDGKPLLSWRVAILPYVGEDSLYKQFHLDEPWDSPHNREVAKKMPLIFQSPDSPGEGKTRVMLFTGKGAAFDGAKKVRWRIFAMACPRRSCAWRPDPTRPCRGPSRRTCLLIPRSRWRRSERCRPKDSSPPFSTASVSLEGGQQDAQGPDNARRRRGDRPVEVVRREVRKGIVGWAEPNESHQIPIELGGTRLAWPIYAYRFRRERQGETTPPATPCYSPRIFREKSGSSRYR